jgi:D-aminopeptidase
MTDARPRAREFGVRIGSMATGQWNAITDVSGVRVGQVTLIEGEGPLVPGKGPVRTGVTVILPHEGNLFREKVPGAIHVINGFGKCMGQEQVDELGNLEGPIALTGTMNVGLVTDAIVSYGVRENPDIGVRTSTINPVVGECSDMYLNDMQGRHVREQHVLAAIDAATSGPIEEGAVGAGTGMSMFGFKGGIGTASRVTPGALGGWTVGVLVLANYGRRDQLRIDGVPVGEALSRDPRLGTREASSRSDASDSPESRIPSPTADDTERGSIMMIVATDAPLLDRGLKRLARRAGIGLARTGSIAGNGSGDYVIAFSSSEKVRVAHEPTGLTQTVEIVVEDGPAIDALFQATVEATEEAILNALFKATTITGRDGNTREALPLEPVREIMRAHGRLFA